MRQKDGGFGDSFATLCEVDEIPDFDLTPFDWQRGAACLELDVDPELFFPYNYGLQYAKQIREARDVCLACPMRTLCLSRP